MNSNFPGGTLRRPVLAVVAAILLVFPLCGIARGGNLKVVAATFPVYVLARDVACDCKGIEVELLVPAGTGCPHEYAPTPADLRRLARADVLLLQGWGLESFLERDAFKGTVVEVARDLRPLPSNAEVEDGDHDHGHAGRPHGDHEHDGRDHAGHGHGDHEHAGHAHGGHEHGHGHGAFNVHLFASPGAAAAMVCTIAEELGKRSPACLETLRTQAAKIAGRLEDIQARLRALRPLVRGRGVLLQHDSLTYLVHETGLAIRGVIQENEDAPPSAARLLAFRESMRRRPPLRILADARSPSKAVATLSAESRVPVLALDPVAAGPADAPAGWYVDVMDANCRALEALLHE
ncbi:MAG: metal ABC transporter substrate-binding protein [Desulfovibrio sp.]|nr:metal ABC transporter substrate-binding protein [Desulfovibrio sp.]